MLKFFPVFLLLFTGVLWSQEPERRLLKGKVNTEISDPENIYVINTSTEDNTATDQRGYFSIMAKEGDTLMFSSVQFKGKSVRLKKEDLENDLFFVRLESMINSIEEVKIINYKNINAVSLGIIPSGQKHYTPAERKLKTASALDGQYGLNTVMSVDPLLNWISGRTAMLKKELEVEKKESLFQKISQMFETTYFTEKLKIPELYVQGFLYYAIENKRFADALKSKNKTMATFLVGEIAEEYKKTITSK